MSAIEKLVVQIFERKKWIIDQAQQQCNLFDQHLLSKLLIDGIVPPPWLCNPRVHPFDSDPKELNKEDLISEVLFPRPHSTIPFSGGHCILYSKLGFTTDDVQYQSGLHSSVHASKKDFEKGDGLSNLPDSSVNNGGCGSTGAPEMDSDAISPQNQMEARISDSYLDPALSLAKLQRSKSRQRALEQRNSSKSVKDCLRDDNNAGLSAGRNTGSGTRSLQLDLIKGSGLIKAFDSNIQNSALEKVHNGDCQMQRNDRSIYSGCVTRSKSLSQKLNSSNVVTSSIVIEDSCQLNNVNELLEGFNPCFTNHGDKEANEGEYQKKDMESSGYHQRLTRSRSSSQTKLDNILYLDTALHGDKGVGVYDYMQPVDHAESTGLIKASDLINGSRKQESNVHNRITLPRSSCQSSGGNNLVADGPDSINKLTQSPQPFILQHSHPSALPVVEALGSQKKPEFCEAEARENLSRSSSSGGSISGYSQSQNHIEGIAQSFCSNSVDQTASHSRSAANKSQNVQGCDLASERSSSSQKDSGIARDSAEENVAAKTGCKNSKALTICSAEGLSKPASSSTIDVKDTGYKCTASNESLLLKSSYTQTVVAGQQLGPQEHMLSGVNVPDDVKKTSAAAVAEVEDAFDGVVEKHSAPLGSILDGVNPEFGLDVSVSRLPSDFVMSMKPRQIDFDDAEESSRKGDSSHALKECRQVIPSVTGLEPRTSLEVTSFACQEKCDTSQETHFLERQEVLIREGNMKEMDIGNKTLDVMPSNKKSQKIPKQTLFLMNNPISPEVTCENSSGTGNLPKEAMKIELISENNKWKNDECSNKILADVFSEAITANGLHGNIDENNTNLTATFTSTALMDELNASLMRPVLSSDASLCQKRDGKDSGFSTEYHTVKNSKENLASDVEHLCHQHKRRKTESEADKLPFASPGLLQKPLESINQSSKFTWDGKDRSVDNLLTSTLNDMGGSLVSSLTEQGPSDSHKCLVDQMGFTNPSASGSSSTHRCTIDENLDSLHDHENCRRGSGAHLNCGERSNSWRRLYSGGNAKFTDGSSVSLGTQCLDLMDTEDTMPEFEGFIMPPDGAQPCTDGDGIELEKLHIPSDTIEHAYILEQIGKSNLMHSPFCSSTPYRFHNLPDLYQSLPNGLLEGMNLRTSLPLNDESGRSKSDCLPYFKSRSTLDTKKPYSYSSPVQTLWDRISSNFGSSGKRESLKPELPCIDEETENADEIADTFQDGTDSEVMTRSILREPLAEITDNTDPPVPFSVDDIVVDRRGLDSVCTEFSFSGTQNKAKQKIEKQNDSRRCTRKRTENQSISFGANGAKRTTESVGDRSSRAMLSKKHSMRKGGLTYSGGKSIRNNIVSNITSFIPLVQQKQPPAVTGKRDIKVKALEAAEAAKRIAEKKENERKMKKEALKLEREKMEQQKLRQLELQKKKKEEERKKKEAEMAVRKRQREEEERKEKERKRKRVEVKRKQQEYEKICAKREEKEIKCRAQGEGVQERTELMDGREKHQKLENSIEENMRRFSGSEAEPLSTRDLTNDETKASCLEHSEAINGCGNNTNVIGHMTKGTEYDDLIAKSIFQEPSYDISPYKGSDDEDEDEDDIPNNKFIPSWASKASLCGLVASQKTVEPETIFPPQSFCNVAEVLLPRKLQPQQ